MKPCRSRFKQHASIAVTAVCLASVLASCHNDKSNDSSSDETRVEKLTMKSGLEYYGWQHLADTFRTCDGNDLAIADGIVVNTTRTCEGSNGPGPMKPLFAEIHKQVNPASRSVTGKVDKVDPKTQTFTVRAPNGETSEFFLPRSADVAQKETLKSMKAGDTVTVTQYTKGRAEEIKTGG